MERRQEYWGGLAIGYMFLSAMGAMIFITAAVSDLLGVQTAAQVNGWVSLAALVVGGVGASMLMLELTHLTRFYMVFAKPFSSIMSLGAWILNAFFVMTFIYATFFFDFIPWSGMVVVQKIVAVLGIITALALVTYPGVEFAEARGRSFWGGGGLVSLFLISGAVTGLAGAAIVTVLAGFGADPYISVLRGVLAGLLIVQLITVIGYVLGLNISGTPEARRSVGILLRGELRPAFWGGFVVVGTLAPLAVILAGSSPAATVVAAILAVSSGYFFRSVFMQAAVRIPVPGEESAVISDREAARLAAALEECWQRKAAWLNSDN